MISGNCFLSFSCSPTHLFLSDIRVLVVLLRRERLKQEATGVPGRQRIPVRDRGQFLEDGVRLTQK